MVIVLAAAVLLVLSGVMLGVTLGPSIASTVTAQSYALPANTTIAMNRGTWVVFEQTGLQSQSGPVTSTVEPGSAADARPGDGHRQRGPPSAHRRDHLDPDGQPERGHLHRGGHLHGPGRRVVPGRRRRHRGHRSSSPRTWPSSSPRRGSGSASWAWRWRDCWPGSSSSSSGDGALPQNVHREPRRVTSYVAPAGWYPDPARPGQFLWWDGTYWHAPRPPRRRSG